MTITLTPEELASYRTQCNGWLLQHADEYARLINAVNTGVVDRNLLPDAMNKFKLAHPFPKLLPNY